MDKIYQLPPILSGSAEQQLRQLRDYLVRLARELPTETQIAQATEQAAKKAVSGKPDAVQTAMTQAQNLKSLIVKTADVVYHDIERVETTLSENYSALSDSFGSFTETINTTIEETARVIVESFDYTAAIRAANASIGELQSALTQIDAEIRRGFIPDPDHVGEYIFGIAVAQNIKTVTGSTREVDGVAYDELDMTAMTALGLYTATGWQFWINGQKAGWFDAVDGMLHVPQIVVEQELKLGADWLVTAGGGFGIRYVGS